MQLSSLLKNVEIDGDLEPRDLEITGIAYDSRRVRVGELFVALGGTKTNGNRFIEQAKARGAAAILSEAPAPEGFAKPWSQVKNGRKALAVVSSNFFGNPTESLRLIGITGTNGKTSTAYLIESILKASGKRVGLISTIVYRGPEGTLAAERTTPESSDLQELFAGFLRQGCQHVVMEVSSHALALDRVHACRFRTAVFTNLTQDHLDYHRTLDNYFEAKKRLFLGTGLGPPRQSVLNLDDPRGGQLAQVCAGRCLTYSRTSPADFQITKDQTKGARKQIHLKTPSGLWILHSRLLGNPNLSNILAAVATCFDLGIDKETIREGVEACSTVPGRFEMIDCGQDFRVIVDYAHTEDALEKVLLTARELDPNRILLLFGCGGERDKSKRPAMGAVAERLSDFCVISSDNPRSEDPMVIIEEITKGFRKTSHYTIEPDREEAIRKILKMAISGDVVVLAGKGHETYQVLADKTIHFDDREIARAFLRGPT
jgi:UDP-N-acetylmuramoyl-L-alanyl-D-glutamate--2,6-diaminopimelate ligase